MIKNDEELAVVREQIQRLLTALTSLKRETGPKGEDQFYVLAEGCVDLLAELNGDVEDYLNASNSKPNDSIQPSNAQSLRKQGAA